MAAFRWLDPGELVDDDLRLVLVERASSTDPDRGIVPAYKFHMRVQDGTTAGRIDLRVGDTYRLRMHGGHMGYGVEPPYRGRRYAARSVRLLLPLAARHRIRTLWITCNPDNHASRRTCELAGGVYVETVDLPPDSDMYARGERRKCRFRFDLPNG